MRVRFLCLIVDRDKTKKVIGLLNSERVTRHFIALAEGTAGTDLMALLGLESREKAFVLCVLTERRAAALLETASRKLNFARPGTGIGFTVPLNSATSALLGELARETPETETEGSDMDNAGDPRAARYSLIAALLNENHVDEMMAAARAAGARGGTVVQGRRLEIGDGVRNFLGIAAQVNKDLVLIISTPERKGQIMKAIADVCGMNTEAQGMIFSLPVDDVEGITVE